VAASQFTEWTQLVHERERLAIVLPHEPLPHFGSLAVMVSQRRGNWLLGHSQGIAGCRLEVTGVANFGNQPIRTDANGTAFILLIEPGEQQVELVEAPYFLAVRATDEQLICDRPMDVGKAQVMGIPHRIRRTVLIEPGRTSTMDIVVDLRPEERHLDAVRIEYRRPGAAQWGSRSLEPASPVAMRLPAGAITPGRWQMRVSARVNTHTIASHGWQVQAEPSDADIPDDQARPGSDELRKLYRSYLRAVEADDIAAAQACFDLPASFPDSRQWSAIRALWLRVSDHEFSIRAIERRRRTWHVTVAVKTTVYPFPVRIRSPFNAPMITNCQPAKVDTAVDWHVRQTRSGIKFARPLRQQIY